MDPLLSFRVLRVHQIRVRQSIDSQGFDITKESSCGMYLHHAEDSLTLFIPEDENDMTAIYRHFLPKKLVDALCITEPKASEIIGKILLCSGRLLHTILDEDDIGGLPDSERASISSSQVESDQYSNAPAVNEVASSRTNTKFGQSSEDLPKFSGSFSLSAHSRGRSLGSLQIIPAPDTRASSLRSGQRETSTRPSSPTNAGSFVAANRPTSNPAKASLGSGRNQMNRTGLSLSQRLTNRDQAGTVTQPQEGFPPRLPSHRLSEDPGSPELSSMGETVFAKRERRVLSEVGENSRRSPDSVSPTVEDSTNIPSQEGEEIDAINP